MRLIDADAMTADLLTVDPQYETMIQWCLTVLDAQPTVGAVDVVRCKDCKHWKDSDGVYRRGFGAESKCPINLQSVYDGTFYCGIAERRQDDKR